ncbi:MAG: Gfo/Idh/MocA family oxidoreductase [Bryobacterales bacterium]|nr:Gfo/Idh/MocA family oxidoreductase [Bryobacterales bacterium]
MPIDRRRFLEAAAAANILLVKPDILRGSARNSAVRLALLGCGGRGTGVAQSFIENTDAQLVGIADLFADALEKARPKLDAASAKRGKPAIEEKLIFRGPDAVAQAVASPAIDAVYIATPPYFHPEHLELAVLAGKHVYVEKPVAVDVPGTYHVRRLGQIAAGKLSLAVGFQLRHSTPYRELKKRLDAGALGDLICGLAYYYAGNIPRPEWPNATPTERRLRNWIFDRTLSGDIIVEQNIHLIDTTNWFFGMLPVAASGSCGKRGRVDSGDCSSHYNVTYTYPNDVHITLTSTQFIKGSWEVDMRYYGTKASAEANYGRPVRITGGTRWNFPGLGTDAEVMKNSAVAATGAFKGALEDADPQKERAFIDSITSGHFLNEAADGADAAVSAILGREAATAGRQITWAEVQQPAGKWESGIDIRHL